MIVTWKESPDYDVKLEYNSGYAFGHITVKKWNRLVLKSIWSDIDKLLLELRKDGYKYLYAYNVEEDEKWFKFVTLCGFSFAFLHPETGNSFFAMRTREV